MADGYKKTIILVEDDEAISTMLKEILNEQQYNIIQCFLARDLWKILHSIIPDLITLDYYIGSADGIKLCNDLRSMKEFDDIPVLFMSASDVPKENFTSCKNVTFIEKPFRIEHLTDKVEKILKGR